MFGAFNCLQARTSKIGAARSSSKYSILSPSLIAFPSLLGRKLVAGLAVGANSD